MARPAQSQSVNGVKFSWQVPIGAYIADFACRERRLVIELDGSQHIDDPKDRIRNDYMTANGWSVARFPSGHVLTTPTTLIETILAICEGRIVGTIVDHDFQFYPAKRVTSVSKGASFPSSGEGERDADYMRRAIALARPGKTWPNPSVGCVLVKDGAIVSEGTTGDGGRPHAEESALDRAGEAARGATAYVTLEPCGQRSNGGCSCSQRLVEAGVARVIYACEDPSPYASHIGSERIRGAGIPLESGLLAHDAAFLIAPTAHYHATGLPLVEESETGMGFDAEFRPDTGDLTAELQSAAAAGYRHLYVRPASALAVALRALSLMV
ncbi:DUF559 domain-containing protein [Asticcacaulis sp. AC466]|uniref:DUF559 domain-containing protein n=1 Tax=Asticcacaulis sp. AC466 TaxID=1282362 RepID=UPI0009E02B7F|nr:DUF559 domain-containing protein [Asticcacaulis sp. AC466]